MIKFSKNLKRILIIFYKKNFGIFFVKIFYKNFYLLYLIKFYFFEYFIESGFIKIKQKVKNVKIINF